MSPIILEAHDLTKKYRHTVALDHIDLQIEKGKIYGFIGQNGAGKTTFLRLVTGLAFQTSGTLDLWGKSSTKDLQEQRKRIGCMIETPALFPAMTAYQNMEIQRIQRGIPDKAVIEKTLNMVGLKDTGKKSVRNFSLGMRQRLGIAIALLNTPEFLILDEPINGLDPAGIVEVRNLLKSLNKEYGMTILVSSHILEELYQTATEFILIDKGKIIEEISDQELNERCKRHIAIKATDPQKALLVLEEKLHTENFKLMPDGTIRLYDYLDDLEKVAAVLSDAHILVTGLSVSGDTLEDYFLSKIGGSENAKWNAAEAVEKQWNSQLARRWVLTIPREIPPDQYAVLVREFCEQQFVSKGMIVDFAIHAPHPPGHNPHAHVLLTMRAMDEHGKWLPKSRKVYDLDENGERIKLPSGRWKSHKEDTVDWNDRKYCEIWRHEWEVIQNRYLEANDRPERVDLRSYARQGLDIVPTVHEGAAVRQMEKRGIQTNIGNLNREIRAANSLMKSIRQLIQNLKGWITELGEKRKELLAQKAAEEATLLPNLLIAAALLKDGKAKVKDLRSMKTGKTYDGTVLLADTGGKYVNYHVEKRS